MVAPFTRTDPRWFPEFATRLGTPHLFLTISTAPHYRVAMVEPPNTSRDSGPGYRLDAQGRQEAEDDRLAMQRRIPSTQHATPGCVTGNLGTSRCAKCVIKGSAGPPAKCFLPNADFISQQCVKNGRLSRINVKIGDTPPKMQRRRRVWQSEHSPIRKLAP